MALAWISGFRVRPFLSPTVKRQRYTESPLRSTPLRSSCTRRLNTAYSHWYAPCPSPAPPVPRFSWIASRSVTTSCSLLLITLYHQDENKAIENEEFAQRLRLIRLKIKSIFRNIIFLEKLDRIVFIYNFNDSQKGFHAKEIETIMDDIFSDPLYKGFCYHASISSKISKLNIPKAHREVLDTQKILRLFHNTNKIMPYEELGIYKLFLNSSSLGNLKNFISPKTLQFRKEYPLLFDTLKTFLDTNQSYHLTSEKLFLHPKTVRYRIDKIKNLLGIDLTNPEELLQIQIAARLFKLIDGRNGIDEQN